MAKETTNKIQRLPKSKNGKRRKSASFGLWAYEKKGLKKEARDAKMSLSYYVNLKLLLP